METKKKPGDRLLEIQARLDAALVVAPAPWCIWSEESIDGTKISVCRHLPLKPDGSPDYIADEKEHVCVAIVRGQTNTSTYALADLFSAAPIDLGHLLAIAQAALEVVVLVGGAEYCGGQEGDKEHERELHNAHSALAKAVLGHGGEPTAVEAKPRNRLWILSPVNPSHPMWDVDQAYGFVIEADTEENARKLTMAKDTGYSCGGSEGRFLNPELTVCVELVVSGYSKIIMCDYLYGYVE